MTGTNEFARKLRAKGKEIFEEENTFSAGNKASRPYRPLHSDYSSGEDLKSIQEELEKRFEELFGSSDDSDEDVDDTDEISDEDVDDTDEISDEEADDTDEVSDEEADDTDEISDEDVDDTDEVSDEEADDTDEVSDEDVKKLTKILFGEFLEDMDHDKNEEEDAESDCASSDGEQDTDDSADDTPEDPFDNIIHLTDEHGNDIPFEFLDLIEYKGESYVVLLPVMEDEESDAGEVVILKVDDSDDDSDTESYVSVDSEETLQALFEIFKEKFQNDFNFTE